VFAGGGDVLSPGPLQAPERRAQMRGDRLDGTVDGVTIDVTGRSPIFVGYRIGSTMSVCPSVTPTLGKSLCLLPCWGLPDIVWY